MKQRRTERRMVEKSMKMILHEAELKIKQLAQQRVKDGRIIELVSKEFPLNPDKIRRLLINLKPHKTQEPAKTPNEKITSRIEILLRQGKQPMEILNQICKEHPEINPEELHAKIIDTKKRELVIEVAAEIEKGIYNEKIIQEYLEVLGNGIRNAMKYTLKTKNIQRGEAYTISLSEMKRKLGISEYSIKLALSHMRDDGYIIRLKK